MKDREQKLNDLLETTKGEREVHRFLEKYPEILSRCLIPGVIPYMVSHFGMGGKYEADFALARGISGGLEMMLVELEPPDASLFTKQGVAAKRLNAAAKQIEEWKRFITENRSFIFTSLSDAIQAKNLLANDSNRGKFPTDTQQLQPFTKVRDFAKIHYVVVIGRSSTMTPDEQYKKATYLKDSFEIMTYDRLLDTARNCDRYHHIFEE